jgi:predicted 3-demethylubiquinone-9 3-methyltransferase (glyoxalase superfamily)
MKDIMPCLWFDSRAEEAANFYVSVFKNSKILEIARYGASGAAVSGIPEGSVMTVTFRINGRDFMALNGGPHFTFSEAVSFVVPCETQEEVDEYWNRLSDGGEEGQCGWLKDRFGLSWQIVPAALGEMLLDEDPARVERVMKSMLGMKKIDNEELRRAYDGR